MSDVSFEFSTRIKFSANVIRPIADVLGRMWKLTLAHKKKVMLWAAIGSVLTGLGGIAAALDLWDRFGAPLAGKMETQVEEGRSSNLFHAIEQAPSVAEVPDIEDISVKQNEIGVAVQR